MLGDSSFLFLFVHCVHEIQRGFQRASASKYVLSNWAKYKIEITNFFLLRSIAPVNDQRQISLTLPVLAVQPQLQTRRPQLFLEEVPGAVRPASPCPLPAYHTLGFLVEERSPEDSFPCLCRTRKSFWHTISHTPVSLLPKTKSRHKYFFCTGSLWQKLTAWVNWPHSRGRLSFVSFLR